MDLRLSSAGTNRPVSFVSLIDASSILQERPRSLHACIRFNPDSKKAKAKSVLSWCKRALLRKDQGFKDLEEQGWVAQSQSEEAVLPGQVAPPPSPVEETVRGISRNLKESLEAREFSISALISRFSMCVVTDAGRTLSFASLVNASSYVQEQPWSLRARIRLHLGMTKTRSKSLLSRWQRTLMRKVKDGENIDKKQYWATEPQTEFGNGFFYQPTQWISPIPSNDSIIRVPRRRTKQRISPVPSLDVYTPRVRPELQ